MQTRNLLADVGNEIFFSSVGIWEIVIKHGLGKLELPEVPSRYIPNRMAGLEHQALDVTRRHALQVENLPLLHRDPFDRLMVAQAQCEGLQLVTADQAVAAYDVQIVWAGSGEASAP